MGTIFEKALVAGWRDMDYNSHMANTAYLDRAADVRMMYFAENGFTAADMLRMKIGPVIMKDEIEYFREVHLLQEIRVTLSIAGSHWTAAASLFAMNSRTPMERAAPLSPAPAAGSTSTSASSWRHPRRCARRWRRCRRSKDFVN
jgi:hypothetical protein